MKIIKAATKLEFIDSLVPAKEIVPDWYRKASKFPYPNNKEIVGFKSCIPFLDSMISGYFLTTPCDIKVEQLKDGPYFSWRIDWEPLTNRDSESMQGIPIPSGYSKDAFAWLFPYSLLPLKGYSAMFTHPVNRFDLPFTTTSGIADLDDGFSPGHIPFFIRRDFEGVIPFNTPIVQIIPFKREAYSLKRDEQAIGHGEKIHFENTRVFSGNHKNNRWHKKIYKGFS